MDFTVGFQINTHGYVSGERDGHAELVRTREELDTYYGSDADGNKNAYLPVLAKYDGAFFASKALLLVTRQESSGSVALSVEGVDLVDDRLEVQITRSAPVLGTMDMARWVIGIELERDTLLEKGLTI